MNLDVDDLLSNGDERVQHVGIKVRTAAFFHDGETLFKRKGWL